MVAKNNPKKRPLPDGYLCFALDGSSRSQKSAYSEERKGQVHEVRKVGACLRCQLLKKSCSKDSPCDTCVRATAKNSASRALAWMECLRPSLQNVTIYGTENRAFRSLHLGGVPVLQYLAHGELDLKFDIPFTWNIDELTTFVAGWLSHDHDAPRASMVGIMSSASLLSAISGLVGVELAQIFKALIHTSSLIFNSTSHPLKYSDQSRDIRVLQYCGQRLLQHFDVHMRPTTLARLRKQELYAMFLMLLGCVMASKYVAESLGDLSFSGLATSRFSSELQAKEQPGFELVRLLSHQLVYVGQAVGLLHESDASLLQDLTSRQWRTTGAFQLRISRAKSRTSSSLAAHSSGRPRHLIAGSSTSGGSPAAKRASDGPKGAYGAPLRAPSGKNVRHAWLCDPLPNTRALRYLNEARNRCACETHMTRFRPKNSMEAMSRPEIADISMASLPGSTRAVPVSITAQQELVTDDLSPCTLTSGISPHLIEGQGTLCDNHCSTGDVPTNPRNAFHDIEAQPQNLRIAIESSTPAAMAEAVQPPSPLDVAFAPFDPELPTMGFDSMFSQADLGEQWAFLSRVPSPSPTDAKITCFEQHGAHEHLDRSLSNSGPTMYRDDVRKHNVLHHNVTTVLEPGVCS